MFWLRSTLAFTIAATAFLLLPLTGELSAREPAVGPQEKQEIAKNKHYRHHNRHHNRNHRDNNWYYHHGRWYYGNPYYYDPYYYEDEGIYYDSRRGGRVIFRFGF